ncbi:MAG: hypothetical protein Q9218_003538 [Villophora microphyllina]
MRDGSAENPSIAISFRLLERLVIVKVFHPLSYKVPSRNPTQKLLGKTTMRPLITILATLSYLTSLTTAGYFTFENKEHFITQGCDLTLHNICGCNHAVDVDFWHRCNEEGRKKTMHGRVCEGTWYVEPAANGQDHIRFEKPGCKAECTWAANQYKCNA